MDKPIERIQIAEGVYIVATPKTPEVVQQEVLDTAIEKAQTAEARRLSRIDELRKKVREKLLKGHPLRVTDEIKDLGLEAELQQMALDIGLMAPLRDALFRD